MNGYNEAKSFRLLSFPYNTFLMLRYEFIQIVGDDLEAKVLRIIERAIEAECQRHSRTSLNSSSSKVADGPLESTCDIWVPISYKMFLNELYGTVASETTLKRALKSLLDKRLIFRRYQPHARYDAPEYKLHVSALQLLLDVLGTAGGQTLISSILEDLKALPAQELTPSECQKLLPSQAGRGADSDSNYNSNTTNNKRGDLCVDATCCRSDAAPTDSAAPPLDFSALLASLATLSEEQKQQAQAAMFGQPPVQPAEAPPPSAPLPQAKGETAHMAEQQQPREMWPVQPPAQRPVIARTLNVQGEGEMSPVQPPAQRPVMARTLNVQGEGGALPGQLPAQRAEAPSLPAPLPQAKGETGQSGGRRRHDHPAPASETRNEPSKETALVRRVEAVFLHLDKLAQQTTGDPNFTWIRSEKAKRAVKQLLADGRIVTPEKLAAVYLHMATMKPNPKTGFTWADKMSVTHVCENYDSIWLELAQAGQQPCLNDTSRGKTPLRTRVVYGCTEQEPTSQPLPVVALQRNTARRWLVEKGI